MGGKSHGGSPLVCFLGLTQIAQISQGFPLWVGNLTEVLRFVGVFGAHTDLTDPTLSFDGGKSRGGWWWGVSECSDFLGLTQI